MIRNKGVLLVVFAFFRKPHTFIGPELDQVTFYVGEHNTDQNIQDTAIPVKAEKVVVHKMYNVSSRYTYIGTKIYICPSLTS